jgi:NADPH:quinone reductase-like Zn-dependent oxidoreductase
VKAIVISRFGGPDALEYSSVPTPEAAPGHVRVAIRAAGVNPVDAGNRSDGSWAGVDTPWIPGYDLAGVVDQVGEGVSEAWIGRRVMAMTPFPAGGGAYAEFATVEVDSVAEFDERIGFAEAAAVPLAGGTADSILGRLHLAAGDSLLVLGASGGVGSFLVQLAREAGIRVVAVSSPRHHARLTAYGSWVNADYADIDVVDHLLVAVRSGIDAMADLVGGSASQRFLGLVRDGGQIAAIATPHLDLDRILDRNLTFHGVLVHNDGGQTRRLGTLLDRGVIQSNVARTFPLSRAADSHRLLERGDTGGTIVLEVDSE